MRNILRGPAPAVVGCDTWLGAAAVITMVGETEI